MVFSVMVSTHVFFFFPCSPFDPGPISGEAASVLSRGRLFQPSLPGASLVFRRLAHDLRSARRSVKVPTCFLFFLGVKKGAVFLQKQLANCKPFEHFW